MKFSTSFTSLILVTPLFFGGAFGAAPGGFNRGGNRGNKGGNGVANNNTTTANNTTAVANNGTTSVNNSTVLANTGNNNNNNTGASGDPQTSTTLDPKVIATGFEQNGQENATAGQVASLTSSNNFINFCLTVPNLPITNGQQVKTGSCNPAPMGIIAATTNMPSSKFVNPVNGQDFPPNTAFTITMAVNNLETGNFVNADSNYYAAPQQVNQQGDIIGHTHFTVQAVKSFTSTDILDPNTFAFFKGVNSPAVGGQVSEPVANGLPAGFYRACSINTDANHTPCLVAVAQHGNIDDCVYFSVGGNGGANPFNGNATANGTSTAPPPSNTTAPGNTGDNSTVSSSAAPAASSVAAGNGNKGNGQNGKGQHGKGGRRARQFRLARDY